VLAAASPVGSLSASYKSTKTNQYHKLRSGKDIRTSPILQMSKCMFIDATQFDKFMLLYNGGARTRIWDPGISPYYRCCRLFRAKNGMLCLSLLPFKKIPQNLVSPSSHSFSNKYIGSFHKKKKRERLGLHYLIIHFQTSKHWILKSHIYSNHMIY
jgi:hypothetical protein